MKKIVTRDLSSKDAKKLQKACDEQAAAAKVLGEKLSANGPRKKRTKR